MAETDKTIRTTKNRVEAAATCSDDEGAGTELERADACEEISPDGARRRRTMARSVKLLIYTPPLIQLFLPQKAMAGNYSS